MFDGFIELNSKTERELDNNSIVLQQRFRCYCFMPHLAWVETDYSDAQQRLVDHWYLEESLVLFGPHVDRLLSDTTLVFAHRDQGGTLVHIERNFSANAMPSRTTSSCASSFSTTSSGIASTIGKSYAS